MCIYIIYLFETIVSKAWPPTSLFLLVNKQLCDSWQNKNFKIFEFKSIRPRFHYKLPLIVKTSKMECNKVIPLVLDKNRSLILILTRFLLVFSKGYQ